MNPFRIRYSEVLRHLPPEWAESCFPAIQKAVRGSNLKVVVLDDDPTGTQTVHNVPVLTQWSSSILRDELRNPLPAFYLLTNSRSLSEGEAKGLAEEIGKNLVEASQLSGKYFVVISRSDSTLRGHFPGEVEALARSLEEPFDGWLLIPFFEEGGRCTINDVHYLREGGWLTPVSETDFARDATFGYRNSNLRLWVEEKTHGKIRAESVHAISLADVRIGGPQQVKERLLAVTEGAVCVVNAISTQDLQVFTLGLLQAEALGRRFLYRTAASFVPIRAGMSSRPLLAMEELEANGSAGGLVVVGSHVPQTTIQLDNLLAQPGLQAIMVDADALCSDDRAALEVTRAFDLADRFLRRQIDVVIYTSRQRICGNDTQTNLAIGRRISEGIVSIVRAISVRPRYLLAKGGITSSDIATKALSVKRAIVLGQILPGVPVWRLGLESRYPGLAYIVFPGNVGGPEALSNIVEGLRSKPRG
jgi:uncharacterized protein YgbK (DUF1537 family)